MEEEDGGGGGVAVVGVRVGRALPAPAATSPTPSPATPLPLLWAASAPTDPLAATAVEEAVVSEAAEGTPSAEEPPGMGLAPTFNGPAPNLPLRGLEVFEEAEAAVCSRELFDGQSWWI